MCPACGDTFATEAGLAEHAMQGCWVHLLRRRGQPPLAAFTAGVSLHGSDTESLTDFPVAAAVPDFAGEAALAGQPPLAASTAGGSLLDSGTRTEVPPQYQAAACARGPLRGPPAYVVALRATPTDTETDMYMDTGTDTVIGTVTSIHANTDTGNAAEFRAPPLDAQAPPPYSAVRLHLGSGADADAGRSSLEVIQFTML